MFIDYLRIAKQAELNPQNRLKRHDMFLTVIIPKSNSLPRHAVTKWSANMTANCVVPAQPTRSRFHSAAA
jgi:hypothetical protein